MEKIIVSRPEIYHTIFFLIYASEDLMYRTALISRAIETVIR